MKFLCHILSLMLLTAIMPFALTAQDIPTRYVVTEENGGLYNNTGRSWKDAKNNIQDAINELHHYMQQNNLTEGRIFVGAGEYTPTESTEITGGSILNTSFKIYAGISVYGGFTPTGKKYKTDASGIVTAAQEYVDGDDLETDYQTSPDDRYMVNGKTQYANFDNSGNRHRVPADVARGWDFYTTCITTLSGNHANKAKSTYLIWNSERQQYTESFPGNSYHVIWFATNGFIADADPALANHGAPLERQAVLDGFKITGGNASTTVLDQRYHTAYGGGVYMVRNSVVRNCRITQNAAARRGGGIYMDGGGDVERCFIQANQCKGIGLTDGYGGGVAVENLGNVRHSMIVDNGASIGGGLAIIHERAEYPSAQNAGDPYFTNAFAPSAASCVVANNTATSEGGGVAMFSGGTINHMTIVRNHCSGNIVTNQGRKMGRSGGLYVDIGGVIFNSTIWGNTTQNNGHVQYSAYVPATHSAGVGVKPYINFTAVSYHDEADWTGTDKNGVMPLDADNDRDGSERNSKTYYVEFKAASNLVNNKAGVEARGQEHLTNWVPSNHSDLVGKGIRLGDYVSKRSSDMINAAVENDIYGNHLAPVSTLGSYMSENIIDIIEPASGIVSMETGAVEDNLRTLFVDPGFNRGKEADYSVRGNSWQNPLVFIDDALHYIDDYYIDNPTSSRIFQILVKEGVTSVTNRQANVHNANTTADRIRLRDLTTGMVSKVRLYGGFFGELGIPATGEYSGATNVSLRNPLKFPTVITANVSELGYDKNVAHVVTFDNVENVIFDGFKVYGGNSTKDNALYYDWVPDNPNGAGILVIGGKNNKVRNCFIANCTSAEGQGAAVLVDGNGTAANVVTFENIVIHNNEAQPTGEAAPAAVLVKGKAQVTFNHCLFRGNIGGLMSQGAGTNVTVTNSAFHANGIASLKGKKVESGELVNDGASAELLLAVQLTDGGTVSGSANNLVDDDLKDESYIATGVFEALFNHSIANNANYTYPKFVNPTSLIGVNKTGIISYYGGSPDFTPTNMNPMVNRLAAENSATDITCNTTRNMGGMADIGPIENDDLPDSGSVKYVREGGTGDGSSWANAMGSIQNAITASSAGNEVWVAAGTYTERITLKNGVNLYGGFIARGNPGKELDNGERDISNTTATYQTTINGSAGGRTVTQSAAFSTRTIIEGFTITNGKTSDSNCGAGIMLNSNGVMQNCLVTANTYDGYGTSGEYGGGGVYTQGTSEIRNCIISHNLATKSSGWSGLSSRYISGGGVLMKGGTIINSLIHSNNIISELTLSLWSLTVYQYGAGIYIPSGSNNIEIYNCTIANNFSKSTSKYNLGNYYYTSGGVFDASSKAKFYNCIFWGNCGNGNNSANFMQVCTGDKNNIGQSNLLYNCYESAWYQDVASMPKGTMTDNEYRQYVLLMNTSTMNSNTYPTFRRLCMDNSPFKNPYSNDYSLKDPDAYSLSLFCINKGGEYQTQLTEKGVYVDISGADRVQDCSLDKGAYEYDQTSTITPDTQEANKAIFYVTLTGNGMATAESPANAACADKLQLVLDAAGRWKYAHPTHTVAVRLATGVQAYDPVEEVVYDDYGQRLRAASASNPLSYSILVPKGVILEGGWDNDTGTTDDAVLVPASRVSIEKDYVKIASTYLTATSSSLGTSASQPTGDNGLWMVSLGETNVSFYNFSTKQFLTASGTSLTMANDGTNWYYDQDPATSKIRIYYSEDGETKYYVQDNRSISTTVPGYNISIEYGDAQVTEYPAVVGEMKYKGFTKPKNPIAYPTVLSGLYTTANNQSSQAYHVVSFTDLVYDTDREPMTDAEGKALRINTPDRAVVDGFIIKAGNAIGMDEHRLDIGRENDVTGYSLIDTYYNPDSYGGAAIVPSYGHIRNCVLEENSSGSGGGALMLKPRALVSGCIFRNNNTSGNGGAIYAYEPVIGDEYSSNPLYLPLFDTNGATATHVDPAVNINLPSVAGSEYRYANIFTSTFVNNNANNGGALYFTTNLRLNSSVLWRNTANTNANISGQTSPSSASADELAPWEYPLQYCAIENQRVAGYNNMSIATESAKGARWDWTPGLGAENNDANLLLDPDFRYALKRYSVLTRHGMMMTDYDALRNGTTIKVDEADVHHHYFPTLEAEDMSGTNRTANTDNNYIEIGARAYDGIIAENIDLGNPMTRIFVAMPEDTSLADAETLINSGHGTYSHEGSSMAYPYNRLDDALAYIVDIRKKAYDQYYSTSSDAAAKAQAKSVANQKFEIFMSRGTHYPYRTITGAYSNTRGNTFLVPEGVAIYGGISYDKAYCQATSGTTTVDGVELLGRSTSDILNERSDYDINRNSIIEGWGFENQTVLSGDVVNTANTRNVFHVITAIAAEQHVGLMPDAVSTVAGDWTGANYKEKGLPIIFDGLQITEGEARIYDPAVQSNSTYYKGGAICIDGNWMTERTVDGSNVTLADIHREQEVDGYRFWDDANYYVTDHARAKRSVGYRNIPLVLRNCYIYNNKACMGGAVFTNGELDVYSTQMSQNLAEMNTDTGIDFSAAGGPASGSMTYYGRGGAIDASSRVRLVNSIFANNSAVSVDGGYSLNTYVDPEGTAHRDKMFYVPNGTGGAIVLGENASLEMLNCNVVNNLADGYPAIYTFAPNAGYKSIGSVGDSNFKLNRHAVINSLFWGNTNTADNADTDEESHYHWLMNPVSKYRFDGNYVNSVRADVPESLWFCAYENDTWYEPSRYSLTDDANDFRRMEYSTTSGSKFVPLILHEHYASMVDASSNPIYPNIDRYNFNILINSDNYQSDGPNFINPSNNPGVDGYTPSADWMMSRINNLVDQGWSYLHQEVNGSTVNFVQREGKYGTGAYYETTNEVNAASPDGIRAMDVLNDTYMKYAKDARIMLRISKDPNPSHLQTYIDIGAYEYQHAALSPYVGSEVDILWVTPTELPGAGTNDGSTWERATSDLQRAIETLLSSRNDKAKEIRMIEGEYMPVYTIDNNLAFNINTFTLDQFAYSKDSDKEYGVKSLTIRGGYSSTVENQHDIALYPTTLTMSQRTGTASEALHHLFVINNAQQRKSLTNAGGTSTTATDNVIPIILEGITFSNRMPAVAAGLSGTAICYKTQKNDDDELLKAPADGTPKLTINSCKFLYNGQEATGNAFNSNPFAAVYVGQGGGGALISNTLFARNSGVSVQDDDESKIINCTFALNAAGVMLSQGSTLRNSLLWRNGSLAEIMKSASISAAFDPLSDDKADRITYNAISRYVIASPDANGEDSRHNTSLGDDNLDVINGPNFANPSADDFSVLPSMKVTGRASTAAYGEEVLGKSGLTATQFVNGWITGDDADETGYNNQEFVTGTIIVDDGENPSYEVELHNPKYLAYRDLAGNQRVFDGSLERGAYELNSKLARVMYVDPAATSGTGIDWQHAYGNGQLQHAIDAAAVYSQNHSGEKSYVFVKGSNTVHMGDVMMRGGVHVYGSLPAGYLRQHDDLLADGVTPKFADVDAFVSDVRNYPERALVTPAPYRTSISSVTANHTSSTCLIDGFELTPISNADIAAVEIGSDVPSLAMRNCVIHGYERAANPVITLSGSSLLYNSLIRDVSVTDAAQPVIKTASGSYVLNCTAVSAANNTQKIIDAAVAGTAEMLGSSVNNVAYAHVGDDINSAEDAAACPFAPYFMQKGNFFYQGNADFTLWAAKDLWYQLSEGSQYLEKGDVLKNTAATAYKSNVPDALQSLLAEYVDFRHDRDLLGNPRIINFGADNTYTSGRYIDMGCFQTWSTGNPADGIGLDPSLTVLRPTTSALRYGGNYYPHEGSVVYIQPGGTIVLDVDAGFNAEQVFRPGYLLLREGGSLYGNGNSIALNYLAVQRNLTNRYNMLSLPFDFKVGTFEDESGVQRYSNFAFVEYPGATDGITGNAGYRTAAVNLYRYDGNSRANSNYVFAEDNSNAWVSIADNSVIDANKGWLLDLGSAADGDNRYVRFTAYGSTPTDWIYLEGNILGHAQPLTPKSVTLTQYDNRTVGSGNTPNFTNEYNMGWNLVGQPYLVDRYQTEGMQIPRIIYKLDPERDGKYAPAMRSWDSHNLLSSEAFFTQTAAIGDEEVLDFEMPRYTASYSRAAKAPSISLTAVESGVSRAESDGDTDELVIFTSAEGSTAYSIGRDGAKMNAIADNALMLYAMGDGNLPMSLLGEAPIGVDIPLGVTAPAAGTYRFEIPCLDAWESNGDAEHVWIIDRLTGSRADLTDASLTASLDESGSVLGRFYLRIGDKPGMDIAEPIYTVVARDGEIVIKGLEEDDDIGIYSVDGMLLHAAKATDTTYSYPAAAHRTYLVRINRFTAKVMTNW